jgi:hypothetical protein
MDQTESIIYSFQGVVQVPAGQPFTCEYIQLPFDVPAGMGEMRLALRYTPARVNGVANLITLGLFDAQGFRGNAHRQPPDPRVLLTPAYASPGFIAGALTPGRWLALLAVHVVLADAVDCQYSLEVELLPAQGEPVQPLADWQPSAAVLGAGPRWFRGELHSHTIHSDGRHTPAELLELARQRGLDFLTISDHNTHSAFQALSQADAMGLLLIPAIELTTFYGHALALGIERWVDWRCGLDGWRMEDAARAIHAAGGLFILAHPKDIGSPFCTGCRWDYDDFDLSLADGVEIWNELWSTGGAKNPGGLALWQEAQASQGRWLATAGTDFHAAEDWGPGSPSVYVYADELSVAGVLRGLRAGRVILSSGAWINLSLVGPDGQGRGVGESLASGGGPLHLELEWAEVPDGAHLLARSNQDVLEALPLSGKGTLRLPLGAIEGGERFWLELYAPDGDLLALTNPVYLVPAG